MTILLAGCSMTPDYKHPTVTAAANWAGQNGAAAGIAVGQVWWATFGRAELDTLMSAALSDNSDILAGIQRVEQARAGAQIAGASLLPAASASGGASRTRTDAPDSKAASRTNLNAGLDVSYELDLFGANRAEVAAARASLDAAGYTQEALALVVMGDVARNYFTLLNQRERLAIADKNLKNANEVLRIVRARVKAGTESDLELSQQQSAVARSEASRESLVEQIANTENALAVLIGKAPQTIEFAGGTLDNLDIPTIDAGQPSALLSRRPDIMAAEAQLVGANADIGAARAAEGIGRNLPQDGPDRVSGGRRRAGRGT